MSDDPVLLTRDGHVATVSLNRPERHNAVDDRMAGRLAEVLAGLHDAGDVRAVVLRGEGASFSSGRDTSVLGHRAQGESDVEFVAAAQANTRLISTMPCPVVAALKGWVLGGAFEKTLHSDIRVAAEDARMGLPEVGYGVVPDTGGVARLWATAGPAVVKDVVLAGRTLDAEEALRWGVVSRVVAVDELDDVVTEIAERIASRSPLATRLAREVVDGLWSDRCERSLREELLAQAVCFASDDYREVKAARSEDRPPRFEGR